MVDVTFTVPLKPQAKSRPRVGANGAVYTPKKTKAFEREVALWAEVVRKGRRIDGPVSVSMLCVFARPASIPGDHRMWRPRRPDGDNVRKAVLDALASWWRDDAQVVAGQTYCIYGAPSESPKIVVRVRELEGCEAEAAAIAAEMGLQI